MCSRTLREEVTDRERPMAPLHYPVLSPPGVEVPAESASSADTKMCAAAAERQGVQIRRRYLNTP